MPPQTAAMTPDAQYGPWNPGIESQIPGELRPLMTIFRPENVLTGVARADEMHDLTGLPIGSIKTVSDDWQANCILAEDTPVGDAVPVVVSTAQEVSNIVTIAVR